ncbi:ribosome maturation factor RimM [Candidatus Pantoea edessiphila]|uniref:Ribosome maturation factor RimM n=1 Tax=Candidatus Pantoea edessiphila TaxID=2044610 RepID=A0A2P5T1K0_9GAMM|nr:ribosome maturation factor RimM [Candidatus Pantoea edessiphila]PPI88474.1 ribosome maturation factor RimM [Candidatus Pantoea edessiphila]
MNKKESGLDNLFIKEPIIIGKIGSVYGVLGWIKIYSFTERLENIFFYKPWFINHIGKWRKLEVINWKYNNKQIITKFKNINNRNIAYELTNQEIIVNSTQLPSLKDGEYYLKDLLNCKVINQNGFIIGIIIDFIDTKSNHVMVVKPEFTGNSEFNKSKFTKKKLLIPFIEQRIIQMVDIYKKFIKINWDINF